MKNLYTFDKFVNEKWFNFFTSDGDKKVTNEMKAGQIVCCTSDVANIIHVYQIVNDQKGQAIFIGNFKIFENNWMFKLSRYLSGKVVEIKDYRFPTDNEKKILKWVLSNSEKRDLINKTTKLDIII